jgi:hypothetical protein
MSKQREWMLLVRTVAFALIVRNPRLTYDGAVELALAKLVLAGHRPDVG